MSITYELMWSCLLNTSLGSDFLISCSLAASVKDFQIVFSTLYQRINIKFLFFFYFYEIIHFIKHCQTYALAVTSNSKTAVGIRIRPSQKTGDVNNIVSLPAITAPTFNDGQKLLKTYKYW